MSTFDAKLMLRLAEESASEACWMYLSFADDDKGGFLGAAVVHASGIASAVLKCHALGINPGGEVVAMDVPDEDIAKLPDWATNHLLTRAQIEEAFGPVVRLGDIVEGEEV